MILTIKHFFDAAHQLPDTEYLITKGCAKLHGHTYAVKVNFEGDQLKGGMVIDFKGIKNLIDVLDHEFINEVFSRTEVWKDVPPSSENIAKFIHWSILQKYEFVKDLEVAVCEGYKGEERGSWTTFKG